MLILAEMRWVETVDGEASCRFVYPSGKDARWTIVKPDFKNYDELFMRNKRECEEWAKAWNVPYSEVTE